MYISDSMFIRIIHLICRQLPISSTPHATTYISVVLYSEVHLHQWVVHVTFIMSAAICYLCYIKQCLGRGGSVGGPSFVPLIYTHQGGGGGYQEVPDCDMSQYVWAWCATIVHSDTNHLHLLTVWLKHNRKPECEIGSGCVKILLVFCHLSFLTPPLQSVTRPLSASVLEYFKYLRAYENEKPCQS